MVKPEFYIEQYPRLVSVIDEVLTQLDAGPLDTTRHEYVKTILKVALLTAEENYIRACEEAESESGDGPPGAAAPARCSGGNTTRDFKL